MAEKHFEDAGSLAKRHFHAAQWFCFVKAIGDLSRQATGAEDQGIIAQPLKVVSA